MGGHHTRYCSEWPSTASSISFVPGTSFSEEECFFSIPEIVSSSRSFSNHFHSSRVLLLGRGSLLMNESIGIRFGASNECNTGAQKNLP